MRLIKSKKLSKGDKIATVSLSSGIFSFYGAVVLTDFSENTGMYEYTKKWLQKTLFSADAIGEIPQSEVWTCDKKGPCGV